MNSETVKQVYQQYQNFTGSQTLQETLSNFKNLCDKIDLQYPPAQDNHVTFYEQLKAKMPTHWQFEQIWTILDKKYYSKQYFKPTKNPKKERIASNNQVLVVGGGPVGIRGAIEMSLLGARVLLVEKREYFSRNNILHLWPYLINDLKQLGAKKFYGQFCTGSINHISIRQMQLILTKAALLLGVDFRIGLSFEGLVPPKPLNFPDTVSQTGWRASFDPSNEMLDKFEFDVIVGADGRHNSFEGFEKQRCGIRPAIGLTCNFVNRNTDADRMLEETSVASHFRAKLFKRLEEKGIVLENLVYFKNETHYFVTCAKKISLLNYGVLKKKHADTDKLLDASNVDEDHLKDFMLNIVDVITEGKVNFKFAKNHFGRDDVALFNFTHTYKSKQPSRFQEVNGRKIFIALIGDSLIEPFWPMGTGTSRGFFAVFDLAWCIRHWLINRDDTDPKNLAEYQTLSIHGSIYQLLCSATRENTRASFKDYTNDPTTRYKVVVVAPKKRFQISHLYVKQSNFSSN